MVIASSAIPLYRRNPFSGFTRFILFSIVSSSMFFFLYTHYKLAQLELLNRGRPSNTAAEWQTSFQKKKTVQKNNANPIHLLHQDESVKETNQNFHQKAAEKDGSQSFFPGDYFHTQPTSPFAYAFLLAGCSMERPYYRGFLYNVVVAVTVLRQHNSTQDVIVMVQMDPKTSVKRLPDHELQWLYRIGCRVLHLSPAAMAEVEPDMTHLLVSRDNTSSDRTMGIADNENFDAPPAYKFAESQMLKFHVLDLVEYKRVLYMDADVMPFCNIDYIFYASMNGTIKENMVIAWGKEPANGGFFLLQPLPGYAQKLFDILRKTRLKGPFDIIQGWGHMILFPDRWRSYKMKHVGIQWNFYAANNDQGLLYYWTKYYLKKVTLIYSLDAENWGSDPKNHSIPMKEGNSRPFEYSSCLPKQFPGLDPNRHYTMQTLAKVMTYTKHPSYGMNTVDKPPYSDFGHFYGPFKPWDDGKPMEPDCTGKQDATSARQYFFHILRQCNRNLDMRIDFQNWAQFVEKIRLPPLEERRVHRNFKHKLEMQTLQQNLRLL